MLSNVFWNHENIDIKAKGSVGNAVADVTVLTEDVGKENHDSCSNVHTFFTRALMVDKGKTRHLLGRLPITLKHFRGDFSNLI